MGLGHTLKGPTLKQKCAQPLDDYGKPALHQIKRGNIPDTPTSIQNITNIIQVSEPLEDMAGTSARFEVAAEIQLGGWKEARDPSRLGAGGCFGEAGKADK